MSKRVEPSVSVHPLVVSVLMVSAIVASGPSWAQLIDGGEGRGLVEDQDAMKPEAEDSTVSMSAYSDGWIRLDFEPASTWHMYGPFQNGSGATPIVQWRLPEGASVEQVLWPVPERYLSGGTVLDHVYHGPTAVLTRVRGLEPGARIEAALEWLVCDVDRCVPVFHDVRAVVSSSPLMASALEVSALEATGGPIDPLSRHESELAIWWEGDELVIDAPGPVRFLPMTRGAIIEDLAATGENPGGSLRLRPEWTRIDRAGAAEAVVGIVKYRIGETTADTPNEGNTGWRSVWVSVPRGQAPERAPVWTSGGEPAFGWDREND